MSLDLPGNIDSIGYFLKQIMKLIKVADNIHDLEEKLQHLQCEVLGIAMKKSVSKDVLETLHNEIETAQEKLDLVNKTSKVKYEELTETCSQIQKVENYLEKLKGR